MKQVSKKKFLQQQIYQATVYVINIVIIVWLLTSLPTLLIRSVLGLWLLVCLMMFARTVRIFTDKKYQKQKWIERNDERYQLIQDKAAKNAYTVLTFLIAGGAGYALATFALSGKDVRISLVYSSIVLVAMTTSVYTISQLVYQRTM